MTVIITNALLATMTAAGVRNNPVVSIRNRLAAPGVTQTSDGATALRMVDGQTWTYWQMTGAASTAAFELPASQSCTMAAIASHNLGTLRKGIRPQRYNGSNWVDVAGDAHLPVTNEPIIWLFAAGTSDRWRFNITDPNTTGNGAAIAVAHVGDYYQFASRFYAGYDEVRTSNRIDLLVNESRSHKLGVSVIARGRGVSWNLEHLPEASVYSADFAAFRDDYNAGRGFFAAWRPADYQTAYYAWRAGDPVQIVNSGPGRRKSLSLNMAAFGDD
jgi:hypothetical protein